MNFDETYKPFADAELGTILWPHQTGIQIDNLDELARWVKERGLFLFDFWGYVPGCGPFGAGDWIQNRPDQAKFDILESVLGDHWLGMDNGEQDGRYVRLYASQMTPVTRCRFDQYLNFQRHFERLGDVGPGNNTGFCGSETPRFITGGDSSRIRIRSRTGQV